MSGDSQETSEVYNYFLELSKPTEEDLKRVFTEEELKELCLKHKCKVDIWKWNVVDDYRTLFTQSGRYQKWSESTRLRMLAKAVNKMKPAVYKEEEIREARKAEWKFQLKDNILSLDLWKRRRVNESQTVLTESEDIDPEVRLQFEVDTESINTAELMMASQREEYENASNNNRHEEEVQKQAKANTVTENVEVLNINTTVAPANIAQTPVVNILEVDLEDDYLTDRDSEDSLETVKFNEKHEETVREMLQSDEVAPEIQNIYSINTMSMTIDSQMSTQSQGLRTLQSQDVIPQNYDNFKNIIPLTSTQSQTHGSEEVILS